MLVVENFSIRWHSLLRCTNRGYASHTSLKISKDAYSNSFPLNKLRKNNNI